ncbi:DUF1848 domain-containing protein [Fusibacter sp. JL298sf-3]
MILSVSRRTDIPAFYSDWFFNRIQEGYLYVTNPMNPKQVSKVILSPETVDCFVFWTKDVSQMLNRLDEIKHYNYYFQYTITGYKNNIELGIKDKRKVITAFKDLSKKIGKKRVILRYDPIFINNEYTIEYHCKAFERLCDELSGYTERCVISFIDIYAKIKKNIKNLNIKELDTNDIKTISKKFAEIANKYNLKIETCSEVYDLSEFGISHGKCIDDALISELIGYEVAVKKDDTQRDICGCVKSVDVGQYNSCMHNCVYCYANYSKNMVNANFLQHGDSNPLLVGEVRDDATISLRDMNSIKGVKRGCKQLNFLDIIDE